MRGSRVGLVLLALAVGACGEPRTAERPAPPAPRVELAGCNSVRPGPVCVLRDGRELRLWIEAGSDLPASGLSLEVDGEPIAMDPEEVDGGWRVAVELQPGARRLEVSAGGGPPWVVGLADPTPAPWAETVMPLYRAGDLAGAAAALETAAATLEGWERARALANLARLERAQGQASAAEAHLGEALVQHRAAGRSLDLVRDATVLVYQRIEEGRFGEARTILDSLPTAEETGGVAEASYYLSYYRGLLAEEVGDLGGALFHTENAVAQARRLALERERLLSEQLLARQLQTVGRSAEAGRRLSDLLGESTGLAPCERGQLLNNAAWSALLALEAGESPSTDPLPLLEEARGIFAGACPEAGDEPANVEVNLALARLVRGEPARAAEHLRRAADLSPSPRPRVALWRLALEARVALAEGRADRAVTLWDELRDRADLLAAPDLGWQAAAGRGAALVALGRTEAAIESYGRAEDLLAARMPKVPLNSGRAAFAAARERVTRQHLELLLAAGRPAEALAVVRRARSRVLQGGWREERLRGLSADEQRAWDAVIESQRRERQAIEVEAEAAWELPLDGRRRLAATLEERGRRLDRELTEALANLEGGWGTAISGPPAAGEALVTYHPLTAGWAGLAQLDGDVVAARLECDPTGESTREVLAACLLEPFHEMLRTAARVRFLAPGSLSALDLHALPLGGEPLVFGRPVVYGLDLEVRGRGTPDPPRRLALVVADPTGELAAARREAREVVASLGASEPAWTVRLLAGEEASSAALRQFLPGAGFFHFAGHATFGGLDGWEAILPLARGGRLGVADILTLARVPDEVVLSGCETARAAGEGGAPGLGLAQAFLARGARTVIAAVRPVGDREAEALVTKLYRSLSTGIPPNEALRRAQIALAREEPLSDWAAFRLLEP